MEIPTDNRGSPETTEKIQARIFTEENPITRYLPAGFIREGAIRPDARIHIWFLGFGRRNQELYRQSVMHNQLVSFEDGTYKVLPVCYHLCDTRVDKDAWEIGGLPRALEEMEGGDYFPLPELPCHTEILGMEPQAEAVLAAIEKQAHTTCSHTRIIIDTGDEGRSRELGERLRSVLPESGSFHIFVRSREVSSLNDSIVTCFGCEDREPTRDRPAGMAQKLNEIYTARYTESEKDRPDFAQYVSQKAKEKWEKLDRFTMYSNIFAVMGLRLKLNLLGLDYGPGSWKEPSLIRQRHGHKGEYPYEAYFTPSVRNAIIAQEHARWNAYHLVQGYLPMAKQDIAENSRDGKTVRFAVKDPVGKRHACLTTYRGLDDLSVYLAERAGGGRTAADYDYYIYDEMLITTADRLLRSLGCTAIER